MKRGNPAVDSAFVPRHGVSRLGQPLSYSRAPSPDLAPWIARLYATDVEIPDDHTIDCGLFNDTTVVRIQTRGDWTAQTIDGPMHEGRSALIFGPQSKLMPITVRGSFTSIGISLRPGAGHAVMNLDTVEFIDRIRPCDVYGSPGQVALDQLDACSEPEQWLQVLEQFIRQVLVQTGAAEPDPITAFFEAVSMTNPRCRWRRLPASAGWLCAGLSGSCGATTG